MYNWNEIDQLLQPYKCYSRDTWRMSLTRHQFIPPPRVEDGSTPLKNALCYFGSCEPLTLYTGPDKTTQSFCQDNTIWVTPGYYLALLWFILGNKTQGIVYKMLLAFFSKLNQSNVCGKLLINYQLRWLILVIIIISKKKIEHISKLFHHILQDSHIIADMIKPHISKSEMFRRV